MIWVILYFTITVIVASALSFTEGADNAGDYMMFGLCGFLWPIWLPVFVVHKVAQRIYRGLR